jgi:hypothetical protein
VYWKRIIKPAARRHKNAAKRAVKRPIKKAVRAATGARRTPLPRRQAAAIGAAWDWQAPGGDPDPDYKPEPVNPCPPATATATTTSTATCTRHHPRPLLRVLRHRRNRLGDPTRDRPARADAHRPRGRAGPLVFGAPTALVLAISRLVKRAKPEPDVHHHYSGPVDQRHVQTTTRGVWAKTNNQQ